LYAAVIQGSPGGTVAAAICRAATDSTALLNMRNCVKAFGKLPPAAGALAAVVDSLEAYLGPIMRDISAALYPQGKVAPAVDVVVCADPQLLELPLEALSIFDDAHAVARDFSLQLLRRRLDDVATTSRDAGIGGGSPKKGSTSAKKGAGKKTAIDAPVTEVAGGVPLELTPSAGLVFAVDVKALCGDLRGDDAPGCLLQSGGLMQLPSAQQWCIMDSASAVVDPFDARRKLEAASALVVYEPNSAVGTFGAAVWSATSLSGCRLAIVLDRMVSPRAQSRADLRRTMQSRPLTALESPVQTAALLSLRGVSSLSLNQWPIPPADNRRRAQTLLQAVFQHGIGKAVRLPVASQRALAPEVERGEGTEECIQVAAAADDAAIDSEGTVTRLPADADSPSPTRDDSYAFGHVLYGCPQVQLG